MSKPKTDRRTLRAHAWCPGQGELGVDVRRSALDAPSSVPIASLITDAARRIAQQAPPLTGLQRDRLRLLFQTAPRTDAPQDGTKRSQSRTPAA